jgi:hypothetical protein
MATKKAVQDFGRQYPLVAFQKIVFGDANDGAIDDITIELPENSIIMGGRIIVSTAFNSGTSDVIIIGHSGDDNYYLTTTSIAATGVTEFVAGQNILTTAATGSILLDWTRGAETDATTGEMYVVVEYVVVGRANENQD